MTTGKAMCSSTHPRVVSKKRGIPDAKELAEKVRHVTVFMGGTEPPKPAVSIGSKEYDKQIETAYTNNWQYRG